MFEELFCDAIGDRVFPGAAWAIGRGETVRFGFAGRHTYTADSRGVDAATIWDLASLTKVVATTSITMKLVEEGRFEIDTPVVDLNRYFGTHGKTTITVKNLLAHNSGFPPGAGYLEPGSSEGDVLAAILSRSLSYETGGPPVYSDVGFIILGKALERITRKRLDVLTSRYLAEGMGLNSTMFRPDPSLREFCAPTVFDPEFLGVVHDPTARLMNGVAGHAGLFSTLGDVVEFTRGLLAGRYFKADTMRLFTTRALDNGSRALGWDTNWQHDSSAGPGWPETAFGHTGFTGTSIWADRETGALAVLLTNRVYPGEDSNAIRTFRLSFHAEAARQLGI